MSTYADYISRRPWDLGTAKTAKHTSDNGQLRQFRYHQEESLSIKGEKCAVKCMKCWKPRS